MDRRTSEGAPLSLDSAAGRWLLLDAGFETSLWICVAVLVAGGALAAATVRNDVLADGTPGGGGPVGDPGGAAPDETPADRPVRHCGGLGSPPQLTRVGAGGHADCDGRPVSR